MGKILTNFDEAAWFSEDPLKSYADTVHTKCSLNKCWCFIDGTVRAICRPGLVQKPFYNGHKRFHGLKFQTIATPDGLVAHMFGPIESCRHDLGMLRESGLGNQLESLLDTPNGKTYCIYGDPAYPLRPQLLAPYKGETSQPSSESSTKKWVEHALLLNGRMRRLCSCWLQEEPETYLAANCRILLHSRPLNQLPHMLAQQGDHPIF